MHYFLDPHFNPAQGILNEEESHHAIKSLRISAGEQIYIGNGKGKRYLTVVKYVNKNEIAVEVISTEEFSKPVKKVVLAVAPTKNPSRFEWFLEKATELGVFEIIPIHTAHTERPRFKHDRALRIIHAAAKQSMRAFIPVLHTITPLIDIYAIKADRKYIAHCNEKFERKELRQVEKGNAGDILILIGPEGDFSEEEITSAQNHGFTSVSLGQNRLRTETAGVFAAAILS